MLKREEQSRFRAMPHFKIEMWGTRPYFPEVGSFPTEKWET
jgi:hypothetical protein